MLSSFKSFLKKFPVPLSRNHRYDLLTKKIIRQCCHQNSNCIDVGAHRGEMLDWFLKFAPGGIHYAFEPIPFLSELLKKKYQSKNNCRIYPVALSDKKGNSLFNYVISNPAYSGLKKRSYDRKKEKDATIEVATDFLDNIIPADLKTDFIKLDVEGAELDILKGAQRILKQNHPIIVFEFGLGGSDVYEATPEKLFSFFEQFSYQTFLLESFLRKMAPLTLEDLKNQFYNRKNYYFVAAYNKSN